ncbi:MAG: S-adenosylmethionine-dependent methyltransferase [Candidatus Woesebacteria bacterium GW2011_GWA1_39_12]|uniref:S-adenosylmethionine-dependent methyltransferase n=1 Tax=Candidatus Woesebacteria bacterium GW2011_GWA1_39_12 TaxID=1618549 RepID=A0A0G0M4C3_9BACT|nr:MAG: S-adenosylmethionine-dependent methyltransferase [Candidatus Woesebacteria bacterium GW2011_GWA1_39_12]
MIPLKKIPFTYQWIIKQAVGGKVKTMLDLGCGDGFLMKILSDNENWTVTGVEIYKKYISLAKKSGVYKKIINGSITNLKRDILNKRYDVVFCSQVVEHLNLHKVKESLSVWEKLAKKRIVITTTMGYTPYEPIESGIKGDDNPYQKHLTGFDPDFFEKRGYVVRGQGLRLIYGQKGILRVYPKLLPLWSILGYLFSPLPYLFPYLGTYLVCWKKV